MQKKILLKETTDRPTGKLRKNILAEIPLCDSCYKRAKETEYCLLSGAR
jgi:hypothetical protein